MTKKSLAEQAGMSAQTLTRLENGENLPEDNTVKKLAAILRYPLDFFYMDEFERLETEEVSFRSLKSMTARNRDAALACGMLAFEFCEYVNNKFDLPKVDLPNFRANYTPKSAAETLRQYWNIGVKPISDINKLLESKGVRIFSIKEDTNSIDAFSCWKGDTPFVFLNTFKTAERSRFDAAHELGHLVMHRNGIAHGQDTEREADEFASNFLMPESDIRSRVTRLSTLNSLIQIKKRWKVSLAALCYRLHKLDIISDWQYRKFCIEINQRFRKSEPHSIPSNGSYLWSLVFSELWKRKITKEDIAKSLHIPFAELENLLSFSFDDSGGEELGIKVSQERRFSLVK